MSMLDHALAWAARGFRVFPLHVQGKRPAMEGWRHLATTDPEVIRKVWERTPYNIGVLTTDLIVVDCDEKNGHHGLLSYVEMGLPTETLAVDTPSGGRHYYLSGPSTRNRAGLADGIDVRSANGYVVAPGSVTKQGAYSIAEDLPVVEAPEEFVSLCGAPRERSEAPSSVELDTPTAKERAVAYLAAAPEAVEGDAGDHTTYKVACAVRDLGLSEDTCYELMLDHWNDRCAPPWDEDELRVKVENAYHYALNPEGVLTPEFEFGGLALPEVEHKQLPPSQFMWAGQDYNSDFEWLLYNRLPARGTGILVGPSNSGKSFFTFALAKALGLGEPFYGAEPDEKAGTLVLAAEGLAGIPMRLKRLGDVPLAVLPIGSLQEAEEVKRVTAAIGEAQAAMLARGVRLGLIVVETLAASRLVEDENDNNQCSQAIRNIEEWSRSFGCFVMVTHHPPKTGGGVRGGSALYGGVDLVIEIDWPEKRAVRYVECTKGRDTPTGKWGSFTLIPVSLGLDRNQKHEITTCDFSPGTEAKATPTKVPKNMDRFMESFQFARAGLVVGNDDPVTRESLRSAFGVLLKEGGVPKSTITDRFRDCEKYALAAGLVTAITAEGKDLITDVRPQIDEPNI